MIKTYLKTAFVSLVLLGCNTQDSISGDDLFEDKKYVEAIEAYSSYLSTNPDNIKSLYNRGRSYEEIGKVENAIADFEAIIKLDPSNVNANLSLAKISYNKNDYNKVLVYTGKALGINENNAQAHFLAGRAGHQLGYFDQALESYNNAITLSRDFGEAYLYRGAVKMGMEKKSSACEDFKFAQSLNVKEATRAIKEYCQ